MNHLVMPWLIEWAGVVLNRYMVYKDGHTAYRNITGKSPKEACGELRGKGAVHAAEDGTPQDGWTKWKPR